MSAKPFWEAKSLDAMTDAEWESLCDGCGQCCLHKLVNDETADVFYTRVACQLLDDETGRCKRYATRLEEVEDCLGSPQLPQGALRNVCIALSHHPAVGRPPGCRTHRPSRH